MNQFEKFKIVEEKRIKFNLKYKFLCNSSTLEN